MVLNLWLGLPSSNLPYPNQLESYSTAPPLGSLTDGRRKLNFELRMEEACLRYAYLWV